MSLDFFTPRSTYIARSLVAATLALGVAYLLELESPYSAASTVLLVINPIHGAVIGKGAWRIIGTVIGMFVACLLMAVAGQMPMLFILGFGFWLGICVAGMTLIRHFRASGVVVAGYTIGLATYGALGHPEATFHHVIGRGSTVVIGVMCLGLVTALLSPRGIHAKLEGLYAKLAGRVAKEIAARRGDGSAAGITSKLSMAGEIYALDDLLAVGKAESEDVAQRAVAVRNGMAELFTALTGGGVPPPPDSHSGRAVAGLQAELAQAWERAGTALENGAAGAVLARQELRNAQDRCLAALGRISLSDAREEAKLLIAADRLLEQVDAYLAALEGIVALSGPRPPGKYTPVCFNRDYAGACRNGLRSMLAIVLAGGFWLGTGWRHGDMMLLVLAPYCALLATAGDPPAAAWEFVKGTLCAVPAAFACAFGILPYLDGFPLLVATLAAFWLPGIYATSVPKFGLAGLAYLVAFNTLVAASNPMSYGLSAFLNFSVAWVLATFFALLAFQVILPRNSASDVARLRRVIRDDALTLLRGRYSGREGWQQRQQHRIAQLGALLKGKPVALAQALTQSLTALHVGRELLRIQRALRRRVLPADAQHLAQQGLERLARGASRPSRGAGYARRTARLLAYFAARMQGPAAERQEVLKIMAAFADIYWLIQPHAEYFDAAYPQESRTC